MRPELAIPAAFLVALVATWGLTPIAMRVARATGFLDRPAGYKRHGKATPYLGGVAIVGGVLAAAFTFARGMPAVGIVVGCLLVLWVLGTIDDRSGLSPHVRVLVQMCVGIALYEAGYGWTAFDSPPLDLLLTAVWVTCVVNAVNLMDNMNGTAATTASISTAGSGVLAVLAGQDSLGALCFGVSGACIGFLYFNLARPSRIFMGDGGSMPLGFLVAYMTMNTSLAHYGGPAALVLAGMLVGLAILDSTLVVVSRKRAGRPIMSGGCDHLTHRLKSRLKTPERVVAALALAQGAVVAAALVAAHYGGVAWLALVASTAVTLGVVTIWSLEQPSWYGEDGLAVELPAADPR